MDDESVESTQPRLRDTRTLEYTMNHKNVTCRISSRLK